jgi:hypothetical protein
MRPTALAGTRRRTACTGSTWSLTREWRTRSLEDRLATLRHYGTWRYSRGRWTRGCGVDRTWTRLRNDQAALRNNRLAGNGCCGGRRRGRCRRWRGCRGSRRRSFDRRCCSRRRRSDRRCSLGSGFSNHCRRIGDWNGFNRNRLGSLGLFLGGGHNRRWQRDSLWRHYNGGRRPHHGLRRDQTGSGLRRFRRSHGRSTGRRHCGLRHGAWGTRRHSRCRRNTGARRYSGSGCRGTRRSCGLGDLLRDRLQYVSRLGDVRQVDLLLELFFRRMGAPARRTASGLAMLGVVLPDALRLVHFNGTGVRLLLRNSDLDQQVENHLTLDLKFPRQVVDSYLLQHSALYPP